MDEQKLKDLIYTVHDDRPQRGWWAPGDYTCQCTLCDQYFWGAKRAGWCAPCAYAREKVGGKWVLKEDVVDNREGLKQHVPYPVPTEPGFYWVEYQGERKVVEMDWRYGLHDLEVLSPGDEWAPGLQTLIEDQKIVILSPRLDLERWQPGHEEEV